MPVDWSPVVCVQTDSKYGGQSYMEPVRNVVILNRRSVSRAGNLRKNNFKSGDGVTILFQKSKVNGVVDFTNERRRSNKPRVVLRHPQRELVLLKTAIRFKALLSGKMSTKLTLQRTPRTLWRVVRDCLLTSLYRFPQIKRTARKHARPPRATPLKTPRLRRPWGTWVCGHTRTCTHNRDVSDLINSIGHIIAGLKHLVPRYTLSP